jgi:hypothetical protein
MITATLCRKKISENWRQACSKAVSIGIVSKVNRLITLYIRQMQYTDNAITKSVMTNETTERVQASHSIPCSDLLHYYAISMFMIVLSCSFILLFFCLTYFKVFVVFA